MTGTIDIRLHADHPDEPIAKHYVFVGSPSCPRIVNVPQTIGSWEIESVKVSVAYPDNTMHTATAVEVDGTYVATLPACATVGSVEGGFQVVADGFDESGEAFEGLCLGVGDLEVLPRMGTMRRGETAVFFHILDAVPTSPSRGDAAVIDGALRWYDGTAWIPFGGTNVVIDQTLTVRGQAADAKATGDAIAEKRGVTDVRMYSNALSPAGPWTWTSERSDLANALNQSGKYPVFYSEYGWSIGVAPDPWVENDSGHDPEDSSTVTIDFRNEEDEDLVIYKATATRQPVPVPTEANLTHASATSGIAKFGDGGELIAAAPSGASDDPEYADYRDPKDNVCHHDEFTPWVASDVPEGVTLSEQPVYEDVSDGKCWLTWYETDGVNRFYQYVDYPPVGEFQLVEISEPYRKMTAKRSKVSTSGQPFVTKDYVDALLSSLAR